MKNHYLGYEEQSENNDDVFDRVPDSLILDIFNRISDVKTLIRCRSVSRRFSSLVPQSDTLLLRVDRVISATDPVDSSSSSSDNSPLLTFLRSVFKPVLDLLSPKPLHDPARSQRSPAQILRGFDRIRELYLELPPGDLRLDKGAVIRWKAEFGKTLRSCVILGFRTGGGGGVGGGELVGGGLKMRVVWTITALIAASARHYYMVREVVREHEGVERVVVGDREEEGTVVMERDGVRECRESFWEEEEEEDQDASSSNRRGVWWGRSNRTKVPAVRMRMRHVPRLELSGGVRMDGATLVVVKPINGGSSGEAEEEEEEEEEISGTAGFGGGVYGEAVEKLLKSRSYILEMNSF